MKKLELNKMIEHPNYIIYDGECAFCNNSLMYIAKKDIADDFVFVSNLSVFGEKLLKDNFVFYDVKNTIILISGDNVYTRADAFMQIFKKISSLRIIYNILLLLPFKNLLYQVFAKFRKKINFKKSCEIPSPELMKKFLH